jgi:hypothetical protein
MSKMRGIGLKRRVLPLVAFSFVVIGVRARDPAPVLADDQPYRGCPVAPCDGEERPHEQLVPNC